MYYDRVQLLLQTGKFKLAEKEARKAIVDDHDDALMQCYLAYSLLGQDRVSDAESEAKRAIGIEPDFPFPHKLLSKIHYQKGDLKTAKTSIAEAIRLDPEEGGSHIHLAYIFFAQRKWEEALAAAEKGLSLSPEDTDGINVRARILLKLKRGPDASAAFDASLGKDPDNPMTHSNLGWALLEEGNYKKSLEHFRESLRLDPNNEAGRSGLIEALKAKYWIYRAYLKFAFFMNNLEGKMRWALIIGAIVLIQFVPVLVPFYLGFVFFSWFSGILFNTLLRLNRFGRYALNDREIYYSNIFAALLVVGVSSLIYSVMSPNEVLKGIGFVCLGMLFPVTGTYNQSRPGIRRKSAIYSFALAAIGAIYLGLIIFEPTLADNALTVFVLGAVGYTWWIGIVSERE